MTMAKKLPLLAPSIHTFEVNGTYKDREARRTVFMAIQKMVSAGKYYRAPYHGSSKKGYSYKRKDGGLTITLADYERIFCSHNKPPRKKAAEKSLPAANYKHHAA